MLKTILFLFSTLILWCSIAMAEPTTQVPSAHSQTQSSTNHGGDTESTSTQETRKKQEKETMQNATDSKVRLKTNLGDMTIALNAEKAPETVANFLEYARKGFYDGTIFHRVIPGFMIQGGGFKPGMAEKSTSGAIRNEADNGLANEKGTIAMARTSEPHSATAQFFINANNNDFLNHRSPTPDGWGYCVFGKLVDGESVLDKINKVSTGNSHGHGDVPVDDVILEKVTIEE